MTYKIINGDCLVKMKELDDNSVHSIVTDPPYGLSFMGKEWDHGVPAKPFWTEALRVAKPGSHLLAFGGTRTYHRLACAIEDAGWEIRDCVMWVYGSGFPKSHNLDGNWEGWGTALKPAWEPIIVARKPFGETVAKNVLKYGTGAMNIDGCRVAHASEADRASATPQGKVTGKSGALAGKTQHDGERSEFDRPDTSKGRWPSNLIHDGSDEVNELFPHTKSGVMEGMQTGFGNNGIYGQSGKRPAICYADSGSAARFFYCAKASKKDRDEGCENLPIVESVYPGANSFDENGNRLRADGSVIPTLKARNHHPTVKPTDLMRYLCRLVTPPKGTILDPFMGSGSTGKGALLEGFSFIGIEMSEEYATIAEHRLRAVKSESSLEDIME